MSRVLACLAAATLFMHQVDAAEEKEGFQSLHGAGCHSICEQFPSKLWPVKEQLLVLLRAIVVDIRRIEHKAIALMPVESGAPALTLELFQEYGYVLGVADSIVLDISFLS